MRVPDKRPDEIPSYTRRGLGIIPEARSPYPMSLTQPANIGEMLGVIPEAYKRYDAMLASNYSVSKFPQMREYYLEEREVAKNKFDAVGNPNYTQQVNGYIRERMLAYMNSPEFGLDPRRHEINNKMIETVDTWLLQDLDKNFAYAAAEQKKASVDNMNTGIHGIIGSGTFQYRQDMNGSLSGAFNAGFVDNTPTQAESKVAVYNSEKNVMETKTIKINTTVGDKKRKDAGYYYNGGMDAIAKIAGNAQQIAYSQLNDGVISPADWYSTRRAIDHDTRVSVVQSQIDAAKEYFAIGNYEKSAKIYQQIPNIVLHTITLNYVDAQGNAWTEYVSGPQWTENSVVTRMKDRAMEEPERGITGTYFMPGVLTAEEQRNFIDAAKFGLAQIKAAQAMKAKEAQTVRAIQRIITDSTLNTPSGEGVINKMNNNGVQKGIVPPPKISDPYKYLDEAIEKRKQEAKQGDNK